MYNLTKKSRKGKQEWEKACVNSSLPPWKLNTLEKTRYIIFLDFFMCTFLVNFYFA
jgi:hypothetical protein